MSEPVAPRFALGKGNAMNDGESRISPFKDLSDEDDVFDPEHLAQIAGAIKALDEELKGVADRAPNDNDAMRLALQIAYTSLSPRQLRRGARLAEATLRTESDKLTGAQRRQLQQEIEDHQQLLHRYEDYFERLQYGFAIADGQDVSDW